ncbi:single-stranded-DNA-specific exonuclease RecJ [uncultured Mitsuokella sp.]|uniref:single-stranded-DNA-specific exonuclease RecJ n=1 Tax=uncultured Mitsuokella sp. TaxID=453120 RepID=UPI0026DB3B9B|nr:single-stranded-DNA-specific exonuclease RecJ [uncultured Mitsuokella sp.]
MIKQWNMYEPIPDLGSFARAIGQDEMMATILWHRGIRDAKEAEAFLHPEAQPFEDPFLMKDMEIAVSRLTQAMNKGQHITVYGDYDVDGMTATSLMLLNLRAMGARVDFYIPDRLTEGYGLNRQALEALAGKTDLLVTVDCGIASVEDIGAMQGRLDIIVTDHHLPGAQLPPAVAVLNPHRADCPYPDKELAGVGVAFKLCQALWQRRGGHGDARGIELAALGTVADLVSLRGENRRIVKEGLRRMEEEPLPGLAALLEVANLTGKHLNAGHVGFMLAPRLNAAGRIRSARQGVKLLTAGSREEAAPIAEELDLLNRERQELERGIVQKAEEKLAPEEPFSLPALVVAGRGWNPGVIGIAASRLVDKYYKPAIVLTIQDDGVCKGSCRSIKGLHMVEALRACREHLLQFGGHEMAAGLSLKESELPAFREAFGAYAAAHLTADDYQPKVAVEFELAPEAITIPMVEELEKLEPYGMGNPKPLFGCRDVRAEEAVAIGRERNHLRFQLGTREHRVTGLMWNRAELAGVVNAEHCDLVYAPAINEWNGNRSVQCFVEELSPAASGRVFPGKETLRDIYRFLYGIQQQRGSIPFTAAGLTEACNRLMRPMAYFTMAMGLRVFQELGLVRESLEETGYYLLPPSGKMDLAASPTFRRYAGERGLENR